MTQKERKPSFHNGGTRSTRRTLIAATVGNTLEWYDITVYSIFATYVAKAFFTNEDPAVALLLTLGTFAVSFLIRPVGAIVLGGYADRRGRKPALTLSLTLMMLGTLLLCVMPTYSAIGVVAPIGILLARLIQGFAAGGEFGSGLALLVETMPKRRGFAASWMFATQSLAAVVAASIGALLSAWLTVEQMEAWGFRIPFVVGLLVGPVGMYIRRHVEESSTGKNLASGDERPVPIREILRAEKTPVAVTIGLLASSTCVYYLLSYIPTYAVNTLGLPSVTGFVAACVSGILLFLVTPLVGHLSDTYGQLRIMTCALLFTLVVVYPLFALVVAAPGLGTLVCVVAVLAVAKGVYNGPKVGLIASLFTPQTRATGSALGYNVAAATFGGVTPIVSTYLIAVTGNDMAPSFWLIFTCILGLVALTVVARRNSATHVRYPASVDNTDDSVPINRVPSLPESDK